MVIETLKQYWINASLWNKTKQPVWLDMLGLQAETEGPIVAKAVARFKHASG